MFDVHCAFHTYRQLKGLDVYQLNLGIESVLICNECAENFRANNIALSGL